MQSRSNRSIEKMRSKSRAKRPNTEPQPSHRRLYQHYRPEAERLKTSTSRPLCTRKRTFDDQGSSPIDGVAVVLELPQEFGFPGAAIIHFGKGDTSKVGTCLT